MARTDLIAFGRKPNKRAQKLLEAGGVEPPSEKPCHPKTTCLARSARSLPVRASRCFADDAQSEQDAPPASPMILPAHYGPKRASQPAI